MGLSPSSLPARPRVTTFTRLAGAFGVLTPIITLTLILVSIAQSPWFSWQDHDLSDLGISTTPTPFNVALLIGGSAYLVFVLGFQRWLGKGTVWSRIAVLLLVVGAVALVCTGLLTEKAGRIHPVVAVTYFVATPLAYLSVSPHLFQRGERVSGALSCVAGLAALFLLAGVPHQGWAVPEILASFLLGVWTLSFGMTMLLARDKDAARL